MDLLSKLTKSYNQQTDDKEKQLNTAKLLKCLALKEKMWPNFHDQQITNLAPFRKKKASKGTRFIAKKHCYSDLKI